MGLQCKNLSPAVSYFSFFPCANLAHCLLPAHTDGTDHITPVLREPRELPVVLRVLCVSEANLQTFNPLFTSGPYCFEKRPPSAVHVSNCVSVLVHETAVVSGVVSKLPLFVVRFDIISRTFAEVRIKRA